MCKALTKLFSVFEFPFSRFSRLPRWLHALLPDRWERPRPFSLLLSQRTLGNEKADLLRGRGGGVALCCCSSFETDCGSLALPPPAPTLTSETLAGQKKKLHLDYRGKKRGGVVVGDIFLLLLSPVGISSHGPALCNEGGRNSTVLSGMTGQEFKKGKEFFF